VRRWFWPYAILAIVLSTMGLIAAVFFALGLGPDRAGAQFAAANAIAIEPAMRFLITMLEMVAPVDLPVWFKQVYAVLVLVALGGFVLSLFVGIFLLPVFYALYRERGSD
jgi:hypothetical protein